MKNNPYDGLNYEKPKYNPIQDIEKWYDNNGKSKAFDTPDQVTQIRERYAKDPDSLSAMEYMILGSAEWQEKNELESQKRQKAAHESRQEHEDQKAEDEAMISTKSEEYQQLSQNLEALKKAFAELNGGGE